MGSGTDTPSPFLTGGLAGSGTGTFLEAFGTPTGSGSVSRSDFKIRVVSLDVEDSAASTLDPAAAAGDPEVSTLVHWNGALGAGAIAGTGALFGTLALGSLNFFDGNYVSPDGPEPKLKPTGSNSKDSL